MIKGHLPVTKESILALYDEEYLFKYYCPPFKGLNIPFCAEPEVRSSSKPDTKPSCRISRLSKGIYYKDFGSASLALDIWNYIEAKYGLTYHEALDKVALDMGIIDSPLIVSKSNEYNELISISNNSNTSVKNPVILEAPKELLIKRRGWNNNDAEYWYNNYYINKDLLEEFDVHAITDYWIDDIHYEAEELAYCYIYYYYNGVLLKKIYQPQSKTRKWKSNINKTVVQGIVNIPKQHDLLFITSSMKDILTLRVLGYYAVAPNNEMTWLPEEVWEKFKIRYSNIYILFDSDSSGLDSSSKFSQKYNIPYIYIPPSNFLPNKRGKDHSDFIKESHNLNLVKKIIDTRINMVQKEQPYVVEYKIISNNRVHNRQTVMYSTTPLEAEIRLKGLLTAYNVAIFDVKAVTKPN
jgi:hypothetical protein